MQQHHEDLRGGVPLGPKAQTPTHAAAEIATLARHADGNGLIPLTAEGRMSRSMVMSGEELIAETVAGVSSLLDPLRVDLAALLRIAAADSSVGAVVEALRGAWLHQSDSGDAVCAVCNGDDLGEFVSAEVVAGKAHDDHGIWHELDCLVVRLGLTELQQPATLEAIPEA